MMREGNTIVQGFKLRISNHMKRVRNLLVGNNEISVITRSAWTIKMSGIQIGDTQTMIPVFI